MNGEQADVVRALGGRPVDEAARCEMDEFGFIRPSHTHAHEGLTLTALTDPQQTDNRSIIIQGKQTLTVQARFHFEKKNKQASSDLSDGRDGKPPSGKKEPQKRTIRAP